MLRDNSITRESTAEWSAPADGIGGQTSVTAVDIDRALRTLAQRRASLDVEEARWLRIAEQSKAWPTLGYVHAREYLEDVFGYTPRAATERMRVAKELGDLPELESALEAGELNYSIVRELTRVATRETVDRWLDAARGRNLRDVERMVSGRRKGDAPDTAPDPKLVKHGIYLDLDAESFALYRQGRAALEGELGDKLDDKAFIAEVARRLLSGSNCTSNTAHGPARMIHISTCPECKRAWQDGAGVRVELDPETIDLVDCDAIIVDEDAGTRARSAIPSRTRRKVLARAEHRCQVPGCRSACNLDIHHIRPRAEGGGHESWNLIVLCSGHHRLRHKGLIAITGRAPDALVFERLGRRLDVPSALSLFQSRARELVPVQSSHRRPPQGNASSISAHAVDATTALTTMGYKSAIAKRAVERACAHVGAAADLTTLIREALRHCT